MKHKNFFITGTDTDIGKTVLSFLIMQYYFNQGITPFYLKPFQTGCEDPNDNNSDAKFIYRNISQLKDKDPAESVIYCFKNPKAPFFAARDENRIPEPERLNEILREKSKSTNPVIIEGAGGLFVPVTRTSSIIDIIQTLKAKIILAARAGLGTINHTLLSIEALKNRGILNPVIVFIKQKNDPISEQMLKENIEAIKNISGIKVAGVIEHINDFSNIDNAAFSVIEKIVSS